MASVPSTDPDQIRFNKFLEVLCSIDRNGKDLIALAKEQIVLSRDILRHLNPTDRVIGGTFKQISTGDDTMALVPIQPGQNPEFQVTPQFSGPPFALDLTKISVSSSDPVNAPVSLDLVLDPTGATFKVSLTPGAVIAAGGEAIQISWTYTNPDGTQGVVSGTLTEEGIVDDVTGGTFAQVV
jgi:hypothetical protein